MAVEELQGRVERIFLRRGLNAIQAGALARTITASERDGCKSHGIYRIEGILSTVSAQKAQPDAVPELLPVQSPAIVRVNANGGFANPAFELGLPELIRLAKKYGLAALVINDGSHFSALWPEIEAITDNGLAALAMCPSYATVAPAGGNKPLLGTNPLAFGWPRKNQLPYVFDIATSVAARGEIELHRRAATLLPEGWAVDLLGQPTTDPQAALAGAMLPFGGHKGSAISTMIELLAGAMIGDATSVEALDVLGTTALIPRHGELIIALSPEAFSSGRPGDPSAKADAILCALVGQGARLPSQRRFAARERSKSEGIALTESEFERLERFDAIK